MSIVRTDAPERKAPVENISNGKYGKPIPEAWSRNAIIDAAPGTLVLDPLPQNYIDPPADAAPQNYDVTSPDGPRIYTRSEKERMIDRVLSEKREEWRLKTTPPVSPPPSNDKTSEDTIPEFLKAAMVQDALNNFEPGWNPGKLDQQVNRFLRTLGSAELSEIRFNEYLGQLVKKLKGMGYTPLTPSRYRRLASEMYKAESLERREARQAKQDAAAAEGKLPARFVAVRKGVQGASDEPALWGMFDRDQKGTANKFITNFILEIDEDVVVLDDIEEQRIFQGTLTIIGRPIPFRINAADYSDNNKLKAKLFQVGGPEVQILGRMDQVRTAISAISGLDRTIRQRQVTTNFGWNGDAFLVPSGRITARGFEPNDDLSIRVELGDEEQARFLDMRPLDKEELRRVKKHIIDDLLPLHNRLVTYSLLASTACSVLQSFAPGVGRFALWLTGLTGTGKSFIAKLFMNFFGDFPVSSGRFATWSSTPNYLQRLGYFFRDSLYLIDDFKPEVIPHNNLVRILQTYADSTARGRLKSDATTNTSRPIRGLLISTGEDVPEHSASAVARSVVIKVPQREKDQVRGNRCVAECGNYCGVMADFISWLAANNRMKVFASRVVELQQQLYADVKGQQNDSRIAANLALLGAAFEQIAEFFSDVWPEWKSEVDRFINQDLIAIRTDMLGEVKDQQASEVFLRILGELIRFNHVRIDGMAGLNLEATRQGQDAPNKPIIGRVANSRRGPLGVAVPGPDQDRLEICTSLALAEVNKCLQQQGRPLLRATPPALLQQLREDGVLLDADGQPLDAKADATDGRVRLDGGRQVRVFRISRRVLLGD